MNADPEVTEFLLSALTREESDALVDRIEAHFDEHGFGLWALEVRPTGQFIGFTGLAWKTFAAHFTPAVEVGWRLARSAWGEGYATEAARAALACGFVEHGLEEVVSMTATTNVRSQRVMTRLGLTRDAADDFMHPNVDPGDPLRPHVLFRITRDQWAAAASR